MTEQAGTVYTREMAFAAAYQHEDGSLCVYNAETGTWYTDNNGVELFRVRRVCELEHKIPTTTKVYDVLTELADDWDRDAERSKKTGMREARADVELGEPFFAEAASLRACAQSIRNVAKNYVGEGS